MNNHQAWLKNRGSVTIEFALLIPLILAIIVFAFAVGRLFMVQALLQWNLHEISRKVSVTQGLNFDVIRADVLKRNSYGLFTPGEVQIQASSCANMMEWAAGNCIQGSTGGPSSIVEYRISYQTDLFNLFSYFKLGNHSFNAVRIVRNEPDLPIKATI